MQTHTSIAYDVRVHSGSCESPKRIKDTRENIKCMRALIVSTAHLNKDMHVSYFTFVANSANYCGSHFSSATFLIVSHLQVLEGFVEGVYGSDCDDINVYTTSSLRVCGILPVQARQRTGEPPFPLSCMGHLVECGSGHGLGCASFATSIATLQLCRMASTKNVSSFFHFIMLTCSPGLFITIGISLPAVLRLTSRFVGLLPLHLVALSRYRLLSRVSPPSPPPLLLLLLSLLCCWSSVQPDNLSLLRRYHSSS